MRLVTADISDELRVGALADDDRGLIDLNRADNSLPRDMLALIRLGEQGLARARQVVATAPPYARIPLSDVRIRAPIPHPVRNIFCVGKNYHDHAREFHDSGFDASAGGSAVPEVPVVFTKASTSVIGPGEPIRADLDPTQSVDYEVELAVVVGQGGRAIPRAAAFAHVFGYTIINDVTARVLQNRHRQWFLGKSVDSFCPMGPILLTSDEVRDVTELKVATHVNGELRQSARVADLIFDIPSLIETISAGITLMPGDIIATGTPAGVGIGFDPPRFLRSGDVVVTSIDRIGRLENRIR